MTEENIRIEVKKREKTDFISTCFSDSTVICDSETLHQYLVDGIVSEHWWDLTDTQRKNIAEKIIAFFGSPIVYRVAEGECSCGGTIHGSWKRPMCGDSAAIRVCRLGGVLKCGVVGTIKHHIMVQNIMKKSIVLRKSVSFYHVIS